MRATRGAAYPNHLGKWLHRWTTAVLGESPAQYDDLRDNARKTLPVAFYAGVNVARIDVAGMDERLIGAPSPAAAEAFMAAAFVALIPPDLDDMRRSIASLVWTRFRVTELGGISQASSKPALYHRASRRRSFGPSDLGRATLTTSRRPSYST